MKFYKPFLASAGFAAATLTLSAQAQSMIMTPERAEECSRHNKALLYIMSAKPEGLSAEQMQLKAVLPDLIRLYDAQRKDWSSMPESEVDAAYDKMIDEDIAWVGIETGLLDAETAQKIRTISADCLIEVRNATQ